MVAVKRDLRLTDEPGIPGGRFATGGAHRFHSRDTPMRLELRRGGSCEGGAFAGNWCSVRIKRRSDSRLKKKARRGFRGFPVATIAFYGPDDTHASKVAVGIVAEQDAEPIALERWFAEDGDVRTDPVVAGEILQFLGVHGAKSVIMTDRLIGCPHEEGVDYPDGQVCPQCPFWAHRDRWTGDVVQ